MSAVAFPIRYLLLSIVILGIFLFISYDRFIVPRREWTTSSTSAAPVVPDTSRHPTFTLPSAPIFPVNTPNAQENAKGAVRPDDDVLELMRCLEHQYQIEVTTKYIDNYYETQMCWTEYKRTQAMRVWNTVEKLELESLHHFDLNQNRHEMYDLIPETYSCDARFMKRIGPDYPQDGGKWICTDHLPEQKDDCVIFSIGSAGDFSFEEHVHALAPKCRIHTFDCTGNWTHSAASFHNWCLGGQDETKLFSNPYMQEAQEATFKTWTTTMKEVGAKRVDLLKMDIEHFEWQVLPQIAKSDPDTLPTQILLELHYASITPSIDPKFVSFPESAQNSAHAMVKMMKLLDSLGYRVAKLERNWFGACCAEVVLIRHKKKQ
ncbi:hypothetical protein HDU85_007587 [Gaertneriomyces sp. JEL0708]|nr:hypothetical protein HDU85_007587 [Gaertneriomyces sp. JEL0708]